LPFTYTPPRLLSPAGGCFFATAEITQVDEPEDMMPTASSAIKKARTVAGFFYGGQGGIRTLDRVAPMPVFETGTFNHSVTCPHAQQGEWLPRGYRAAFRVFATPSASRSAGYSKVFSVGRAEYSSAQNNKKGKAMCLTFLC
jgi:hypothetical protein